MRAKGEGGGEALYVVDHCYVEVQHNAVDHDNRTDVEGKARPRCGPCVLSERGESLRRADHDDRAASVCGCGI